jgi:hypothetical protein
MPRNTYNQPRRYTSEGKRLRIRVEEELVEDELEDGLTEEMQRRLDGAVKRSLKAVGVRAK